MRKKCSSDQEKLLKFEAEGQEFAKFLRSLEQTSSNSERSEQFLVTECLFFSFVLGSFSYLVNKNNSNSNWKKLLGFRNMQEKLEKNLNYILK